MTTAPKTVEHLRDELVALDRGPLDEDEMARMRRIGDFIHGR